tara:strand:+ start:1685 stop:1936 length:252 start_codon:yes stop_codon:yes gene_type:complete
MLDMFRCGCGMLVLKDWWWIVGGWLVKEDIERVVMCDKCSRDVDMMNRDMFREKIEKGEMDERDWKDVKRLKKKWYWKNDSRF